MDFLELHVDFTKMLLIKVSHLFIPPLIGSSFKEILSDLLFVLSVIATILSSRLLTTLFRNHI